MRKSLLQRSAFALLAIIALMLVACSDETPDIPTEQTTEQTLFVYMPWSVTSTSDELYKSLLANIDGMEQGIKDQRGLGSNRVLVFLSTSADSSSLFEIKYADGQCSRSFIKRYQGHSYTTASGLASLLTDVKTEAPADHYAMVIGGHGSGWTYKADWQRYPYKAPMSHIMNLAPAANGLPRVPTRAFGSVTDMANYATDIEELASALTSAQMKMDYILFDDCYMANAETAYALQDVSQYLVASTSEVMAIGMPYSTMMKSMLGATPDYSAMVEAFYNYYSTYTAPYGALSVIDCSQMDSLASLMKQVNATNDTLQAASLENVQRLGGFSPTIYYDFGNYVDSLCKDETLLASVKAQLAKAVPYSCHTQKIYSYLYVMPELIDLNTYSGLTISDPSTHPVALKGRERTGWWNATH